MTNLQREKPSSEIRVGISQCLLGDTVRYDGGHKHDAFLTGVLGKYFTWIPVCPEMEIGLGAPRESMRLVRVNEETRLITHKSGRDLTDQMNDYAEERTQDLEDENLHGFILKKDSPSCGLFRVKVHQSNGTSHKQGRGLFAEALSNRFPNLPIEEEGRLNDLSLRENFIERVFAYHRWTEFLRSKPRAADIISFHSKQKMAVLSHSRTHYQNLGQLIAQAGKVPLKNILEQYATTYMDALKVRATPKKHANVLYHIAGFFKKEIDSVDKAELVSCIENYRNGLIPLIVPITLLNHYLRRHPSEWISQQTYLNPYPAELMLRNHV
jgi:uncharacterized protein YbgA (DUF1722 family)/uncharacterized protein YbbK (DUF523 family)